MPIVTAQRKKQQTLIGIVGLVILVSVGVLFLGGRGKKPAGQIFDEETPVDIFVIPKEIKLDLTALEDPRFKNLVPYEKLPTDIDTGRSDPFLPYVSPEGRALEKEGVTNTES